MVAGVQLTELMDPESGFLGREGLILRVDVLECCPWFEFADLETYASGTHSAALRATFHMTSKPGPVIYDDSHIESKGFCMSLKRSIVPWIFRAMPAGSCE